MWRTNLAVGLTVLGTLGVYTAVANVIPQVESEVPEELELGAEVTPEELVAAGERVYTGAGGCAACHGLGTRAPDLLGVIGTRCAERVPELDCKEYLWESLVDPRAHVVEGFQPIMPDMRRTLDAEQLWAVVAFLQSQGGEVTVTGDDLGAEPGGEAEGDAPPGGPAAGATDGTTAGPGPEADAAELLETHACLSCHRLDGRGAELGPPLDGVGARLGAGGIRRAILAPRADTTPGYEAVAGLMPADLGQRLSAAQLETLVRFLTSEEDE